MIMWQISVLHVAKVYTPQEDMIQTVLLALKIPNVWVIIYLLKSIKAIGAPINQALL